MRSNQYRLIQDCKYGYWYIQKEIMTLDYKMEWKIIHTFFAKEKLKAETEFAKILSTGDSILASNEFSIRIEQ